MGSKGSKVYENSFSGIKKINVWILILPLLEILFSLKKEGNSDKLQYGWATNALC